MDLGRRASAALVEAAAKTTREAISALEAKPTGSWAALLPQPPPSTPTSPSYGQLASTPCGEDTTGVPSGPILTLDNKREALRKAALVYAVPRIKVRAEELQAEFLKRLSASDDFTTLDLEHSHINSDLEATGLLALAEAPPRAFPRGTSAKELSQDGEACETVLSAALDAGNELYDVCANSKREAEDRVKKSLETSPLTKSLLLQQANDRAPRSSGGVEGGGGGGGRG